MPRYHYRCEECSEEFEATQRITENPLTNCPKCNGEIYRVISSNIGLSFKGSGFHVNDYKSSSASTVAPTNNKKTKDSKKTKDKKRLITGGENDRYRSIKSKSI